MCQPGPPRCPLMKRNATVPITGTKFRGKESRYFMSPSLDSAWNGRTRAPSMPSFLVSVAYLVFPSRTRLFWPLEASVASNTWERAGSRNKARAKKVTRNTDSAPTRNKASIGPRGPVKIERNAACGR